MPPADVPAPSPRRPPVATSAGTIAVVSLLFNVVLGGWIWHIQTSQAYRLSRLETFVGSGDLSQGESGSRPRAHQATRQERIALLLAASSNPDEVKRLLSAVPLEEALEIARVLVAQPAANNRNEALDATLRFLAIDAPVRALNLLAGMEESGLKSRLAHHLVGVWMNNNPEGAARWLGEGGGQFFEAQQISEQLAAALARWSAFAPDAAARFIDARPPDGDLQPTPIALALEEACLEWSRKDTAAAVAWAQALPASDPRQLYALSGVVQGWTEQDPSGASAFVRQTLESGSAPGAGNLALVLIQAWSAQDAEAAAAWSASIPDPAVRQLAMREAATRWAQADSEAAARWASGLPSDPARDGVWVALAGRWAESDPARLEAWLESLPAGHDCDDATGVYISKLASQDPEKALTWTRTLTSPGAFSEQARNVLGQWELRDTAAARNWAAANAVALPQLSGGR